MKLVWALLFCCCFLSAANAQNLLSNNKVRITGNLRDSATSSSIPAATLQLRSSDGKIVKETFSDSLGNFNIELTISDNWVLQVTHKGYHPFGISIPKSYFISNTVWNQSIRLSTNATTLKEVVVVGTKSLIENKTDKIVYNAEKDITSQGGMATDILRKIPQVTVDINGNVEILGNPSVQFLINGKPSTLFGNNVADALQSIPASQIQSIEVISSPGAKYDATGTGGIINIVLKKNKLQGFSGVLNLTAGTRLENASVNLNYKKNKIGLTSFFAGSAQLTSTTLTEQLRNSEDTLTQNTYALFQNGQSAFSRYGYKSGITLDWDPTANQNISLSLNYNRFGVNNDGFSNQQVAEKDVAGNLLSAENSRRQSLNTFDNSSFESSLDYRRKSPSGKKLLVLALAQSYSGNKTAYRQSRKYASTDSLFGGSRSTNPGKDFLTTFSIDYSNQASKAFTLETGIRFSMQQLTSHSAVYSFSPALYDYTYDTKQSYSSRFNRQILAGYISTSLLLFKQINFNAGLRLEHTFNQATYSLNNQIRIPDYNNAGPSLLLSHQFKSEQIIKLSYSYRLERPEFRDLNPFVNLSDPHNIATGNPAIQPEIGREFQLGFNQPLGKENNLNITLVYTHNKPDIKSYTTFFPSYKVGDSVYTNVNVTLRDNIAEENRWGANISFTVSSVARLNVRANVQLYDRITKNIYSLPMVVSGFEYRGNVNISYLISKSISGEAFGNYNAGIKWQGRRAPFSSYTFAIRKQLFHSKGSLGITAVNAFGKYLKQRSTQEGVGFSGYTIVSTPYRSVGINFIYKFGKLKISKPKEEENYLTKPPEN